MARNASNALLHKAKGAKSDEFYTLLDDIERELVHYESDFNGKTVYCNCDDPYISNFYKYFHDNFKRLGLKRLIASCYRPSTYELFQPYTCGKGYYTVFDGYEADPSAPPHIVFFKGDGDFRSQECIALLQQSDIIVTNPPFSLFREFVSVITSHHKSFLIIGNINAITYKDIFKLIQQNKAWLGVNLGRGISGFIVPESYSLYGTETRTDEMGNKIISPNNCLWLTNLETPSRREFINLSKVYAGNEMYYPKYDNYEGINVNRTQDIPKDYPGVMGVPITFLHKYNPHQFEIVRFRKGNDARDLAINGKCPYFRILIRNKVFAS